MVEALETIGRLLEEVSSPEEKARLLVAFDALRFINATGQSYDFEDYRASLEAGAPPLVVAAFESRDGAEEWLDKHPAPPHQAYVLIGGAYHIVMFFRDSQLRRLVPHPVLEFYLADLIHDGAPAPVATFATREEAEDWLQREPSPPRQVFVTIAGEPYLAAYHYKVGLRALYPAALAAPYSKR